MIDLEPPRDRGVPFRGQRQHVGGEHIQVDIAHQHVSDGHMLASVGT